jgi:hypothetical protein
MGGAPAYGSTMISIDDFLTVSDRTFDGFRKSLERLDDDTVNAVPDLPEANSAFHLVVHTLGALDWWTSRIVLGHHIERDRPAEFLDAGTVAHLDAALDQAQAKLHQIGPALAAATTIAPEPQTVTPLGAEWTAGACIIHAYEEMAQHLGHLEITVDLVGV